MNKTFFELRIRAFAELHQIQSAGLRQVMPARSARLERGIWHPGRVCPSRSRLANPGSVSTANTVIGEISY
jgi:hypothetical protein